MPIYRASVPAGRLTSEQKRQIAVEITDIHCACTNGTPRKFVHVIFEEVAPEDAWTGGEPSNVIKLIGLIRGGRSKETRQQLVLGLTDMLHRLTGAAGEDIAVGLQELDPGDIMEWGQFLPGDGEEAAWVAEHGLEREGVRATK